MSIRVRPATTDDLPAIGRLAVLLVQAHHDFDPDRFLAVTPQTEQGYAGYIGSQLGQKKSVVLAAELNGEVVGYAWGAVEGTDYMALRGPAGVLYDIVVDPSHRETGVGRMLLDAVVQALEALNAHGSCSPPPRAMKPPSASSRAPAFGRHDGDDAGSNHEVVLD
jgi:ribosomal protein S18 acetylase RimI-like enzyme